MKKLSLYVLFVLVFVLSKNAYSGSIKNFSAFYDKDFRIREDYKDIAKDKCSVSVNYKFKFLGLQILLYPLIKFLIQRWNDRTWHEDLPLKLRRQRVKRMNFKDFKGLPNKIKERKFSGPIDFKLPISRLKKDDNRLKKHPFYNFGSKDVHI